MCRTKHNRQLISHDEQNSDYFYKYTNFVELAPICRDDLVILPPKIQKALGGIGPLILVYKMTTCVHVVDIKTMRTHEIASPKYWENPFMPICSRERLSEFIVINIEDVDFDVSTSRAAARNKFRMVRVELMRSSEFGTNNRSFMVHTHLGEFINFNDTVLCYDLDQMTIQELEDYDNSHKHALPDVVIVKKSYPKIRRRQQKRIWRLKRMDMAEAGNENFWEGKKGKK